MSKPSSPYVGLRPFEREHAPLFFGRDREANELVSLIISHTEVLLYAQSGAGKSSLVNARLIPLLEAEDFDVLPPARVQGVAEGVEEGEIQNIYAFHSLMTWAGREADPKRFARMSLADFLRERKCLFEEDGSPKLRVAIFDQFEELFTFYPERWQERRAFFVQVREASKAADPGLRTVFVMREDYLAEIDPYAPILPEKFRNRFCLERMLEQSALSCVQEPLKGTPRRFAPRVAGAFNRRPSRRMCQRRGSGSGSRGRWLLQRERAAPYSVESRIRKVCRTSQSMRWKICILSGARFAAAADGMN